MPKPNAFLSTIPPIRTHGRLWVCLGEHQVSLLFLVTVATALLHVNAALAEEGTSATAGEPQHADLEWQLVRENEQEGYPGKTWVDVLVVPELDLRVTLMDSFEGREYQSPPWLHTVNPETLKLRWLGEVKGRKLLWIQWETFPLSGTGHYTDGFDAVIDIRTGGVLVRESSEVFGRLGNGTFHRTDISFELGTDRQYWPLIVRHMRYCDVDSNLKNPVPLSVHCGTYGVRHFAIEQTTGYRFDVEDRYMKYDMQYHTSVLDLSNLPLIETDLFDDHTFTLDEVAEFLVLYLNPRYGEQRGMGTCSPEERETMKEALLKRNPELKEHPDMRTRISIPTDEAILERKTPGNGLILFEHAREKVEQ